MSVIFPLAGVASRADPSGTAVTRSLITFASRSFCRAPKLQGLLLEALRPLRGVGRFGERDDIA
jgi:hypothetical protein